MSVNMNTIDPYINLNCTASNPIVSGPENNVSDVSVFDNESKDGIEAVEEENTDTFVNETENPEENTDTDTDEDGEFDYSIDDGKISLGDKVKNFAKGLVSPITSMFKSPKNFLTGVLTIGASALLIAGTGGAAAPVLVAAGLIGGGIQFGKCAYKAATADSDEEAREAWQGMGAGTTVIAGSIAGAKSALKGAGVEGAENMGILKSTVECVKQTPKSIAKSFGTIKSGAFTTNIKNVFSRKNGSNNEHVEELEGKETEEFFDEDITSEGETPFDDNYDFTEDDDFNFWDEDESILNSDEVTSEASEVSETQTTEEVTPEAEMPVNDEAIPETPAKDELKPETIVEEEVTPISEEELGRNVEQMLQEEKAQPLKNELNNERMNIDEIDYNITIKKAHNGIQVAARDADGNYLGSGKLISKEDAGYMPTLPEDYLANDCLYVDSLRTSGKYKYTGTKIIEDMVKYSNETGREGRLCLMASEIPGTNIVYHDTSPVPFYYKLGFRFNNDSANIAVENAINSFETTGAYDLGKYASGVMYLPKEAIAKMLN